MVKDSFWVAIWKWTGPQRIQVSLRLVVQGKVKGNVELHRRHITTNIECSRCNGYVEEVLHVLGDCFAVWRVWSMLIPNDYEDSFRLSLNQWCIQILKHNDQWNKNCD